MWDGWKERELERISNSTKNIELVVGDEDKQKV
jgi:hypothetical protein